MQSGQGEEESLSALTALRALTHAAFAAFVVLALATPAWRVGPFTWWPVWQPSMLAGRPASVGVLSLLPGGVIAGWLTLRLVEGRSWRWGPRGITLPLLGLTVLALVSLEPVLTWRTVVQVVGFGLAWLVYLFVLNERPKLIIPLAFIVLIQAGVAVGQFWQQSDLGLALLGELTLDPATPGISVLVAGGRRWLRAYGLTAHPNVLGATLTVLLLLLLPAYGRARGWRQLAFTAIVGLGLLGLLASFSRAAWLGFAAGLLILIRETWQTRDGRGKMDLILLLSPFVIMPLFLFLYRDLVVSRFLRLSTPIEAHSLAERARDAGLASELVVAHPWRGVGAGNFQTAVQELNPNGETVHNVFLLVTAELGLVGGVLWLWLALTPFVWWIRRMRESGAQVRGLLQTAPWLALLTISLFDNTLWLSTSWRAAILFALVAATVSGANDQRDSVTSFSSYAPYNAAVHR